MKKLTLKIGVLMGGWSSEREVSLRTGEAIYKALIQKGYRAEKIDVGRDIAEVITRSNIDLAYLALHGRYGEDGTIQGMLEILGIPYTGSGVLASALAMDKIATKKIVQYEGLPTPPFTVISKRNMQCEGINKITEEILNGLGLPVVIKAPTQGSTIGTSFVYKENEIGPALELAFKYDPQALVEKFIDGIEVTSSVLGNDEPEALPLIEIVSATGVYDYQSKYTVGLSDHIIPPRLPEAVQKEIKELAVKVFRALGCRGLARIDFMVSRQGRPYILEVNTIPGMTETSLFPDAARAAGIDFPDLVEKIVNLALEK